eukprot:312133_1
MSCAHCLLFLICVLCAGWIATSITSAVWTRDLIQYESTDCIDLSEGIPNALLTIASFNGLLLFVLVLLICMKIQDMFKELLCLSAITYLVQIALHITLFVYITDVYWLSSRKACHFDEEVIETVYYFTAVTLAIPASLCGLICISTCFQLATDPDGFQSNYFADESNTETELMRHAHGHGSKAGSAKGRFKINQFRGCLDWEDYKAVYEEADLKKMLTEKSFEPLSYEGYFILIEVEPQKAIAIDELESFDDTGLRGNLVPFEVTVNGSNNVQNGYALYDEEKEAIMGVHRIVCPTHEDFISIEEIKFTVGNERNVQQTIQMNHEQNVITLGQCTSAWEDNRDVNARNCSDISQAKVCKFKELGITLYFETITIHSSMRFPDQEQCQRFAKYAPDDPECKQHYLEMEADEMPICFDAERNMQVYYNSYKNMVYGVNNDTVNVSATHCGFGKAAPINECQKYVDGFVYYPYYFENITQKYYMFCRYHFVMDFVLRGMEEEFNVFKTLLFLSANREEKYQQLWSRLALSILVLLLQGLMLWAMAEDVIERFDLEEMFTMNHPVIMTLSFAIFAFLSYRYCFTIIKMNKFYTNIHYVCDVDVIIPLMDYISNVVIYGVVVFFSFSFLLLSHTIQDAVFGAFALTFITELDDMANIFDADEDFLLEYDWQNCVNDASPGAERPWDEHEEHMDRDWDPVLLKRKINLNIPTMILKVVVSVLLSPLFYIVAFVKLFEGLYYGMYKERKAKMDYTKNTRTIKNLYS